MISKTLIPSVLDKDRWRRYFKVELLRAFGYCRKILELYDRILSDSSNPLIKKMIMGIIGRDTIGHWRDIQMFYRKFFGITCTGCEDAIKHVAMGIPLDKVVNNISITTINKWKLMEDIRIQTIILSNILNKVDNKDDALTYDINALIKRLSSNPLEIFRLVRGFYSVNISILPLYNECTFFLYITRSIPKDLINQFFSNIDISVLSSYGIKFDEIKVCRDDEFSLLVPSNNSINQYIITYIEVLYRVVKQSLRLSLKTFFKVSDEELNFISTMVNEAKKIEKEMNFETSVKTINIIRRNSSMRKIGPNYRYFIAKLLFYRDKDKVAINSNILKCEDLFNGLSPYFITGLAYFNDIQEKENNIIKAKLHLYYYNYS